MRNGNMAARGRQAIQSIFRAPFLAFKAALSYKTFDRSRGPCCGPDFKLCLASCISVPHCTEAYKQTTGRKQVCKLLNLCFTWVSKLVMQVAFTYRDVKNLSGAFFCTDAEVVICNWGVPDWHHFLEQKKNLY